MSGVNIMVEDFFGHLCNLLIPIETDRFMGEGKTVGVCTLSSLTLLKEISADQLLMKKIALVGRLLSENKGIDQIIRYCSQNESLRHLVVCGIETKGHLPGDALICLHQNGVGGDGRILNSMGHRPFLSLSHEAIEALRKRVSVHNLIGVTDVKLVKACVFKI
jgi:tetrahydromethanopterin S-methyltransferase subunit A